MNQELLDKWLNGEISPSEMEVLKMDPNFTEYLKIDAFVKQIEMPSHDTTESLATLKKRVAQPKEPKVFKLTSLLKYAAVAAIVLMVGYFYMTSLPQTFKTELAQKEIFELPDSSNVILNENSQLSFKKANWDENRSLDLQGEAFFEVAKGNTFDVHTHNGIVSVLGTRFNVLARENSFEVVCYEGLVQVTFLNDSMKLSPGQKARLKDGKLVSEEKYTTQPGWIHDESTFNNVKVEAVLEELKSVYNIHVITENIDVDLRYTGTFTNSNLDAALQTITLPLGIDYAIENKNVILFTKE
jgi:ferric-dicitrate binding protein FerR (iron transport regulator)